MRGKCGTEKYSVILQRKWLGRLSLAAAPAQDLRGLRLLLLPAPGDGIDALGPMRIIMLRDRGGYPLRGRAAPVGRGAVHVGRPLSSLPAVGVLPFLTVRMSSLLFFCVCMTGLDRHGSRRGAVNPFPPSPMGRLPRVPTVRWRV